MTDRTRGNLLVTIQLVLLALLGFAPGGTLWPVDGFVGLASWALVGLGVVILVVSFVNLGSALTAHPVPLEKVSLKTTGLYAVVRHPIYLGLLVLALGLVVLPASPWHIAFFVALSGLLHVKAGFEERLLRAFYPEYEAYARRVGRLIPRLAVFGRGER
jgi:protein-S-isoprenylcysteine O-methyltransferase Ste14